MIYRTKPTEVSAHEWVPSDEDRRLLIIARLVALGAEPVQHGNGPAPVLSFWCEKSNRHLTVAPGDYVIEEADGIGVYPCVRAEFKRKYEPAEPEVDVAKAMEAIRGIHPISRGAFQQAVDEQRCFGKGKLRLETTADALRADFGL